MLERYIILCMQQGKERPNTYPQRSWREGNFAIGGLIKVEDDDKGENFEA